MTLVTWLSVVTICCMGAMSPGPSLAVVVRNTVGNSRGHGLATAWAHASGIGFYALGTALGLSAAVASHHVVYVTLATLGALYLAYLGVQALRAGGAARLDTVPGKRMAVSRAAGEGFLIAFLNPKVAFFFLALFSQFVHPGMALRDQLALSLTALTIDGLWYSLVAVTLSRRGWLDGLRRHAGHVDRATGALLIALAVVGLVRLASG